MQHIRLVHLDDSSLIVRNRLIARNNCANEDRVWTGQLSVHYPASLTANTKLDLETSMQRIGWLQVNPKKGRV